MSARQIEREKGALVANDSAAESDTDGHNEHGVGAALHAIFSQKIAFLLVFVPIAFVTHAYGPEVKEQPLPHFLLNLCAIVPLAWLISECTEHLEKQVGSTIGVLLNSSFGNIVEIILSVQAILHGAPGSKENMMMLKIVQASLLGAILSNLLFVLGCCFFVSGLKKMTIEFNSATASYNLTLLSVAAMAMIVPTGLAAFDEFSVEKDRLWLSRAIAICLALMYMQWLFFNLWSHAHIFAAKKKEAIKEGRVPEMPHATTASTYAVRPDVSSDDESDDDNEPTLPMGVAALLLLIATILVAFTCDYLVEAINPVAEQFGVKKAFIATVLLPMVGNFSEEIAAVTIASKGKIDLAMGVAIGSATQIATLAIPAAVMIAWANGRELDLDFEVYQAKLLFCSIIVASLALADGQANWLKGSMLITAYTVMAASFYFIHDKEFDSFGVNAFDEILGNSTKMAKLTNFLESRRLQEALEI